MITPYHYKKIHGAAAQNTFYCGSPYYIYSAQELYCLISRAYLTVPA